jgi:hypothetical protein
MAPLRNKAIPGERACLCRPESRLQARYRGVARFSEPKSKPQVPGRAMLGKDNLPE